jgi:four helix bundle protein
LARVIWKREPRDKKREMSRKRHNYKNLKIWMLGIQITYDVFKIIDDFPKEEKFGLASQISRCSISIPSNIAEGSSRTDKSFSHFLDISLGSSFELETQLIIAGKRKYISKEQLNKIEDKIAEFQKMTIGFQNKL